MSHPLVEAAARVHPFEDVLRSVAAIASALDARLAERATLDWVGVQQLISDVCLAHTNTGGTARGWFTAAMAALAMCERATCPCGEACRINVNVDGRLLASGGAGSRATERAYLPRARWR